MIGNLSILHPNYVHGFKLYFAVRGGDAGENSIMGAMIGSPFANCQ